jgi:hypothetical protein
MRVANVILALLSGCQLGRSEPQTPLDQGEAPYQAIPSVLPCLIEVNSDVYTSPGAPPTVWKRGCAYHVTKLVRVRSTLTIEPGVVVNFAAKAALLIDAAPDNTGKLEAVGTSNEHIVLTGDQEVPGFWQGVVLKWRFAELNLDYVDIGYAGGESAIMNTCFSGHPEMPSGFPCPYERAALYLEAGTAKITNSFIHDSAGRGLRALAKAELTESGNTYSNNAIP